jgi:hypothetical protein
MIFLLVSWAASVRQNIRFAVSRPFYPGASERPHDITDQSPISPSTTAAAPSSTSSGAFRSQRSAPNHPLAEPLPGQIPIGHQPLIASREFVHRRLSDAGPLLCRLRSPARHPKPRPIADMSRDYRTAAVDPARILCSSQLPRGPNRYTGKSHVALMPERCGQYE